MDKSNQTKPRLLLIIPELRLQLQMYFAFCQTSWYGWYGNMML
jgi:hypothetical protein